MKEQHNRHAQQYAEYMEIRDWLFLPMTNQNQQVTSLPIDRKMLLSIREAAEYSNIGINKIDELLKQPNCPFVLYVGTKKLVKRKAFEEFIEGRVAI